MEPSPKVGRGGESKPSRDREAQTGTGMGFGPHSLCLWPSLRGRSAPGQVCDSQRGWQRKAGWHLSCCQALSLIFYEALGECPKPMLVSYFFVCLCFNKMGMMGVWCEISYYGNSLNQTVLVPKLLPCFKSGAPEAAFKPVIYRAIFCQAEGADPASNNVLTMEEVLSALGTSGFRNFLL